MKINSGSLAVRSLLKYTREDGETQQEKVSQLRIYSGAKFTAADTVCAGEICAVPGLEGSYPGQGLGGEGDSAAAVLEPVLCYRVLLREGSDPRVMYSLLRQLEEEDPQLHVRWHERQKSISVQLMGKVQTEILKSLVKSRFDADIDFDRGEVMYRETVEDAVEGVGHFEPLRHYAEVHLLIEPLPRDSGIVLAADCSEDELDKNWQRLILTHLAEKRHLGVLTGSPLTDVKITLRSGRAHLKHTEGGDFRQATYRAVRQGLMQAKSILLEPYYAFTVVVQPEELGRAMGDIKAMGGETSSPESAGDMLSVSGSAPVAAMNGYYTQLASYTHGRGRLSLKSGGYRPCRDAGAVIERVGYDAQADQENTADSVFCAHGGGFNVKWDEVSRYMHLESCIVRENAPEPAFPRIGSIDERELESIMEREFGPIRRSVYSKPKAALPEEAFALSEKQEYVIVDGYNLIFAWPELKMLAEERLDLARGRLADMLSSYCAFTKKELVLVFDGYKTPGNPGEKSRDKGLRTAFTPDGETADAYIEGLVNEIGQSYAVRVVTNDNMIRLSALGAGVLRCSSAEFKAEVENILTRIAEVLRQTNYGAHQTKLKDGKQ